MAVSINIIINAPVIHPKEWGDLKVEGGTISYLFAPLAFQMGKTDLLQGKGENENLKADYLWFFRLRLYYSDWEKKTR